MIKVSQGVLGDEELAAVKEAFTYGYYGHAQKTIEFETELSKLFGGREVVATHTGTSALQLALEGLGIGDGDEVIVPSLTFVASFQAISATGATPVACEVRDDNLCIDIEDAEKRITSKTKAIMPVHYTGNPCDMESLLALARQKNLRIVEDAAHAFGSVYQGKNIGSFGDVTCFSFDSIKNMTCGEGGAVVTADKQVADLVREKRLLGLNRRDGISEGKRWLYQVSTQGYRYHMSNINAAIGLVQLKRFPEFKKRRQEICRNYVTALQSLSSVALLPINYDDVCPHIFVIRVKNGRRDEMIESLSAQGIEVSMHYIPNHIQPLYQKNDVKLPVTDRIYGEILTLPLHCLLADSDVNTVVEAVKSFLKS